VDDPMKSPPAWRRYLRFWGTNRGSDVDAELEFHVTSRTEELIEQGSSPAEARLLALREFGDYSSVRREVDRLEASHARRLDALEWLSQLGADVRYAMRSLRKSPGFAAVVVLTLALGIGLNSTIFSLVNAYLFRPLDLTNAERLIVIGHTRPLLRQPHEVPYRDLQTYGELRDVFEGLAGFLSVTQSLNDGDRTDRIWMEATTGNYFSTLRPPMTLGHGYQPEASARNEPVIVLSHEFWMRRFAADSSIVGRSIRIGDRSRTVLGVAAASYRGLAPMIRTDAWAPIDESPVGRKAMADNPDRMWFNVVGMLRPGVSVSQARDALRASAKQLEKEFPSSNKDVVPVIVPETRARPVLAIAGPVPLMAAVLLALTLMVLIVACANVASLLLARGTAKHREYALRSALGASRWRLTRQALLEAAILSIAGSVGAVALAEWSTNRLASIRVATDAPLVFDLSPDWRVFAFTLAAALLTTLLAGLVPAVRNAGVSPQGALVAGGRSATERAQQRLRSVIVVGQIAVSVIVLIAAGLFARSMRAAQSMELGFKTKNVVMAQFDLSLNAYDSTRARAFQENVLARVRELPAVRSAALAARIPFGYSNNAQKVVADERSITNPDGELIFQNVVSTDYFRTAGPTILEGREFSTGDNGGTQHVAVVNEAMAAQLWPKQRPVGKVFHVLPDTEELRVVGVARSAQYMFLGEPPRPFFWTALGQRRRLSMFLEVATAGDPDALIPAVRRVVRELDPNVPLFEMRSMEDHLRNGRAMFGVRVGAMFGASFALLALLLAAVGVYGLVSYSVSHRTREIGIRIAIGATVGDVIRLVLRQSLTLALIGVVLGAIAALGATRMMSSLLYGVESRDPLTFAAGALLLAAIAGLASWVPARRAASMDPVRALRVE
jgi:predicted permease